jgi:hypothetical protein
MSQILKHIYTRCQEEVEKMIPPGMALLSKLLRTEQYTIRANLYRLYVTPRVSMTIETPDGKPLLARKDPSPTTGASKSSFWHFVTPGSTLKISFSRFANLPEKKEAHILMLL